MGIMLRRASSRRATKQHGLGQPARDSANDRKENREQQSLSIAALRQMCVGDSPAVSI